MELFFIFCGNFTEKLHIYDHIIIFVIVFWFYFTKELISQASLVVLKFWPQELRLRRLLCMTITRLFFPALSVYSQKPIHLHNPWLERAHVLISPVQKKSAIIFNIAFSLSDLLSQSRDPCTNAQRLFICFCLQVYDSSSVDRGTLHQKSWLLRR